MGLTGSELITSWKAGVVDVIDAEVVPAEGLTRGYNTALYKEAAGETIIGKREGWQPARRTSTAGPYITAYSDTLTGMLNYIVETSGTISSSLLFLAASGGEIYQWDPDNSSPLTTLVSTSQNAFHANKFVRVGNEVYDIGAEKKWIFSTTLTAVEWGNPAPSTSATIATSSSGLHSGTYLAKWTEVNEYGVESDAAPVSSSLVVTNQQILWTLPAAPTGHTRKLYLKDTVTMTNWYYVDTITTAANTTHLTNVANSSLTIPLRESHAAVPSGIATCLYKDRIFVLDKAGRVYWSGIGNYEYFNITSQYFDCEYQSGDYASAIVPAFENLYIFKGRSIWQVEGSDPKTWTLTKIFDNLGHWSPVYGTTWQILVIEGTLYFWDRILGPIAWNGPGSAPEPIGIQIQGTLDEIIPTLPSTGAVVGHDPVNTRIIWVYNGYRAIIYNYRFKAWESTRWDPFRITQMCTYLDLTGRSKLYASGPYGKFYIFGGVNSDGLDGYTVGTTSTNVTIVTATAISTLTVSGASWPITTGGLANVSATFLDTNSIPHTRGFISTNTSSVLTFNPSPGLPTFTSTGSYTVILGGPYFEMDTKWASGGRPTWKKRYEFLTIDGLAPSTANNITVGMAFDRNPSFGQSQSVATAGKSCTWNATIWGDASTASGVYGTSETFIKRLRIGRTGRLWKVRIGNYYPDQTVKIKSIGVDSELLTQKLG